MVVHVDSNVLTLYFVTKNQMDDYLWNLERATNTKWFLPKRNRRTVLPRIWVSSSIHLFEWKMRTTLPSELYKSPLLIYSGNWFEKSYKILQELHDSNSSYQDMKRNFIHFLLIKSSMWLLYEIVKSYVESKWGLQCCS